MKESKSTKRWKGAKRGKDSRDNRKFSKDKMEDDTYVPYKSRDNDPNWYAANPQLLKDSASYPYTWPVGNPINYGPSGLEANNWSIPGIMTIEVSPEIGYADNINSAVNIASRNMFSYIRHANSGSANYDAPDLMIYNLAMDSAYMMLSHFKRIYGVIMTSSYTNRYYPRAMTMALGGDYDDLTKNLADFRALLNSYIVKIGSLCVPATMSYMRKHSWMFEGLYFDQPIDKAQTYAFVPHGWYTYKLDDDGAGMLLWNRYHVTADGSPVYYTLDRINTVLSGIIDPILSGVGAQDFNIMSGDILKAYGSENVIKLEGIPENYSILPQYSEEVLDQIQNLSLIGEKARTGANVVAGNIQDIRQDANKSYLVSTPKYINYVPRPNQTVSARPSTVTTVAGDNCFTAKKLITFTHDQVDPSDTVVATRMTNIASDVALVPNRYAHVLTFKTLGSESANIARIWRFEITNGNLELAVSIGFNMSWSFMTVVANLATDAMRTYANGMIALYDSMHQLMSELSYFHRHPLVAVTAGIVDAATGTWDFDSFNGYFGDVNYYSVLGEQDLIQMSDMALLSEFAVAQYGRSNSLK